MTLSSLKTPIIYPEPDGAPMAESDPARDYLVYGVESLKLYYQDRADAYVSGNLWLSYERGVPDAVVCPDVFVVFGVEKRPRRSYRVWEENDRIPSWVLEVTSASTHQKDDRDKPIIYAQMGVSEYFQYDPTGDYLNPPLKGRRLIEGTYQFIAPEILDDGSISLFSEVLALEMRLLLDGRLRFFNPRTEEYLRTYDEVEQAREQAEVARERERLRAERERLRAEQERLRAEQERLRAEQERLRAEQAETTLQELQERLQAMGLDPDNLSEQ